MTLSILKAHVYGGIYVDVLCSNVYRDNKGNAGWNNSKMTITADYGADAWQSTAIFFTMLGF